MSKLILGFAGEMASGKGTVTQYICEKYQASSHRFSTVLRDVLNRLYIEQSRENLQELSTTLRHTFGEDILAKVILHDTHNDVKDVVVIDGVRRLDDIVHLHELSHFKLVYIKADDKIRYERIIQRTENTDDQNKTFEEFMKEQEQESESQIRSLEERADFVVENNGSVAELRQKIDEIIEKCKD